MSHSGPSAVAITLSEAERAELVRRTNMPHRRSAEKARIILACADGMSNAGVARLVGVQAKTVGKWRRAFAAERMAGLEDAGWIGRPKADLILEDAERRQLQQWARQAKMLGPGTVLEVVQEARHGVPVLGELHDRVAVFVGEQAAHFVRGHQS